MNHIIDCIKDPDTCNYYKEGLLHIKTPDFEFADKFAIFDLDETLISNSSGRRFFISVDDWVIRDNVKDTLKKYSVAGYSIIIISNQTGLSHNINRRDMFIKRLDNIIHKLDVPICFLAATSANIFKKPSPAIYNKILRKIKKPSKVFYCGDAAGRESDFSDSDIKFAMNAFIRFYLPEHIFGWNKNAKSGDIRFKRLEQDTHEFQYTKKYDKELILMIGFPASGKSTISNMLYKYHGFKNVSNDIHKKYFNKFFNECMDNNYNIVIDNTNLSIDSRKKIIYPAKKNGYKIRAFVMDSPYDQCIHNNFYRAYTTDRELIPLSAYKFMKNKFNYPTQNEGIDSIEKIKHSFVNTLEYTYFFPTN
jgi:bifunctional polynucleotide phosphatase/kinase